MTYSLANHKAREVLRAFTDDLQRGVRKIESMGIRVDLSVTVTTKFAETESDILDEHEAAAVLGVHPAIAAGLVRCGALEGEEISNRRCVIRRASVEAYSKGRRRALPLLTLTEAAVLAGVDRGTIRNRAKRARLKLSKPKGKYGITLIAWRDLRKIAPGVADLAH